MSELITTELVVPTKVTAAEIDVIRSMQRLKLEPGWQQMVASYEADLVEMEKERDEPINLLQVDPAKAMNYLAIDEVNRLLIRQLRGLINYPDNTIAKILKKYEDVEPAQAADPATEVYS